MQATYDTKTGQLTIVVATRQPSPSKSSGKTMTVAYENVKEAVEVNGKKLTVQVTAYYKP